MKGVCTFHELFTRLGVKQGIAMRHGKFIYNIQTKHGYRLIGHEPVKYSYWHHRWKTVAMGNDPCEVLQTINTASQIKS